MFFKLGTPAGSTTHAGLLEFSAAEGFVALPLKVCAHAAPDAQAPCWPRLLGMVLRLVGWAAVS